MGFDSSGATPSNGGGILIGFRWITVNLTKKGVMSIYRKSHLLSIFVLVICPILLFDLRSNFIEVLLVILILILDVERIAVLLVFKVLASWYIEVE